MLLVVQLEYGRSIWSIRFSKFNVLEREWGI